MWESVSVHDAEYLLVGFGLSARICKSAVTAMRRNGVKAGLAASHHALAFPHRGDRRRGRGQEESAGRGNECGADGAGRPPGSRGRRAGRFPRDSRGDHAAGGVHRGKDHGSCRLKRCTKRSCMTGRGHSRTCPITTARVRPRDHPQAHRAVHRRAGHPGVHDPRGPGGLLGPRLQLPPRGRLRGRPRQGAGRGNRHQAGPPGQDR